MDARLNQQQVRDVYRRFAPTYDLWGSFMESRARRCCLDMAQIKNGEDVLEVAVGTGVLFEQLLHVNPNGRNEGVDLTPAMLQRARDRLVKSGLTNYVLQAGDAYHLDYPQQSFDVLFNNYMFDLIPERDFTRILAGFNRVLRSGGRLALVNMTRGASWFNSLWDSIYRLRPSLLGGCRAVELAPYVEAAGFSSICRRQVSQLGFPSEVIVAVRP